jgi:guanine deaminase
MPQNSFMEEAIELSRRNVHDGAGGPFAAIVVKDGQVIARGTNRVTSTNDPTAHAEVIAIREACRTLKTFRLVGCELYATCEPCPMCLGAIYWARLDAVYYASTRDDAARIGFDDLWIYQELSLPLSKRKVRMTQMMRDEALVAFHDWEKKADRVQY